MKELDEIKKLYDSELGKVQNADDLNNLRVMFLGSRSGKNDDGSQYFQGQFLEKSSNQTFRMYFPDDKKINSMKPYTDYDLEVELYINSKGQWAIRGL